MKNFKFIDNTDYPFDSNTFDEMQADYKLFEKVISMLVSGSTTTGKYIIYGCEINGANLNPGLMLVDGELVRFGGGAYYGANATYISIATVQTSVNVEGVPRLINEEKHGSTTNSIMVGTYLYDSFVSVGKLRRDGDNKLTNFTPFASANGITVNYAKALMTPYELKIRLQVVVDLNYVTNSAAYVEITGWQTTGSYGNENTNHLVGDYAIMHIDNNDVEQKMNVGKVFVGGLGKIYLIKPYTIDGGMNGLEKATFDDLADAGGASYPRFKIEMEARITRSTI